MEIKLTIMKLIRILDVNMKAEGHFPPITYIDQSFSQS